MINYIWAGMILVGIVFSSITGNINLLAQNMLDASKEAVTIAISMLGVVAMWSGIMEIAIKSGIINFINLKLSKVLNWLFPEIPANHKAREYIATNFTANILGLGWAATPSGLMAMKELSKINGGSKRASNAMCTFLVINISSLQLIPINIIAYRSQYGSLNSTGIVIPGLIATCCSTIVGVIFCKVNKRNDK